MAAAAHFGLFRLESACFGWNRHVSVAVSAISILVSARIGPDQPILAQIGVNLAELARIKKKRKRESRRVRRRTLRRTPVQQPWIRVSAF